MDKIKQLFIYWSESGLRLPGAFDANTGKPSITLLAVHLTLWLTSCILIYSLFKDLSNQVWTAIAFWCMANIFYLIKKITKVKLDADDKALELEGGDETPNN